MPHFITAPSTIEAAGNKPKRIEEFAGRVNTGQAVITKPGEWVRNSTPLEGGAEYIAVCLPAFSPDTVNRDE